jgi:hypothetical protein
VFTLSYLHLTEIKRKFLYSEGHELDIESGLWIFSACIAQYEYLPFSIKCLGSATRISCDILMKVTMISRQLLHMGLACTCLVLVAFSIADSATLKDVRLGDHDAFTRVVLEFDITITLPAENKDTVGLVLTFPATRAGLVRKIPNYQSSRIDQLTLWEKGNTLSIRLAFNFENFRYEFLELSDPYRLVVDIFPKTTWPLQPASSLKVQSAPANPSVRGDGIVQTFDYSSEKAISEILESESPESQRHEKEAKFSETDQLTPGEKTHGLSLGSNVHSTSSNQSKQGSGLQSYLIIALVVITIIILSLLVLMLLSRYRWAEDRQPVNLNALLQKQEDHIASINARIKEQLKRYDEA